MKPQRILKKDKNGKPYLEVGADLLSYLEWAIGDRIEISTNEVWKYNRITKTCTLRNITQENYDKLAYIILGIGATNTAPNREE